MKQQQFTLMESEARFLAVNKTTKNYDGKKKPVSKIEPLLPDSNTCKPKVKKKPFKFHCINCGEEYLNAEKHEKDCNHSIFLLIECPVCFDVYCDINQHIHYEKQGIYLETQMPFLLCLC